MRDDVMQVRVRARKDILDNKIEMYVLQPRDGGRLALSAQPLVFAEDTANASWEMQPTFNLSNEEAQRLFDDLWQAGLRPEDYAGEGVVKAMQAHIDTLRQVLQLK